MAGVAIAVAVAAGMVSCSLTKYVAEDEMLLDKIHVEGDMGNASESELEAYVRQRPNSRFLHLWRVGLGVYSLSGEKDNRMNRWLRKIGQEPVTYSEDLTERTAEQLRLYLVSKGYYDATVTDSLTPTRPKRCQVTYTVQAGRPYKIHSLAYSVPNDEVGRIIMADTANSLLKVGDPFDSNTHDDERERITRLLQERGYYFFGKDYVYFVADSAGLDHAVRDSLIVVNALGPDQRTQVPHRKAVIDSVAIVVDAPDHKTGEAIDSKRLDVRPIAQGMTMVYEGRRPFRDNMMKNSCFIVPGDTYRLSDVELTRSRLVSLKAMRQASFFFAETDSARNSTDSVIHVSCTGRLTTNKLQSFGFDVEGTNSSGNIGAAVALRYSHANVFRGAEAMTVKTRLATQRQTAAGGKDDFYTLETGVEATLTFPFMMLPHSSLHFYKHHNPKTLYSISFDFQRRPEFTRKVIAARMTYNWRGSAYAQHSLTPLEFNIVRIPTIDASFEKYIAGTYLQYAYTDHFIMSLSYTFTFNQQKVRRNQSGAFFRFGIETAGNALRLMTGKQDPTDGFRKIWDIRYAQYVKTEAELRYQAVDLLGNNAVFRFFGGIGVPYGNSVMLPFEKSYFVGGANSIRAWPVRGLGPGQQKPDPSLRYHNQTSDIRLEANAEYRFKIISVFEGAAFVDAGNIWALNRSYNAPEAVISGKFYKQVALGAGLGLRLNFDYFIFRVDAAYKLRDPQAEGDKWVVRKRFDAGEIAWNFAIGYPF